MSEQLALIKEFEPQEEVVEDIIPIHERDEFDEIGVLDVFKLPVRNWTSIIDNYNKVNKRKFLLTPLECKILIEYVKQGQPPQNIFIALGHSIQRYTSLVTKGHELDEKFDILSSKEELTSEEFLEWKLIITNPLRILLSDIERAKGLSNLEDWERFNNYARRSPDMNLAKMKMKYKEFSEKEENGTFNVQINLAGSWFEEL